MTDHVPTHHDSTHQAENVRYLVTIDLERGRTLKVLRQMPDGSLHEVRRAPLGVGGRLDAVSPAAAAGGLREPQALDTLH